MPDPHPPDAMPPFRAALRVWARIGLLSFGGPAAQIALLHREIVERRRWLGERRFLNALGFCALLPGPEAQQLATYLGTLMHGPAGGIAAGTLFVLPGAAVLLALSIVFVTLGQVPAIAGVFFGLKCAVLALVAQAVLRLGARALNTRVARAAALATFVALNMLAIPFPLVIAIAGTAGAFRPAWFHPAMHGVGGVEPPGLLEAFRAANPAYAMRQARAARRAGVAALALWLAPLPLLRALAPGAFADVALFFSKMSVVSFGGAYAALGYVAQIAVHTYHWLSPAEMLAGLGLAETTPGPLILVLQFVGFMAGYRAPGALTGIAGGIAASAITLWFVFMPCFAFVLLGAPLVESLTENRRLGGALAAVTASVVGVIANLALWFGLHVLFAATVVLRAGPAALELPRPHSLNIAATALSVLACVLLLRLRWPMPRTLAVCAAAGALLGLLAR